MSMQWRRVIPVIVVFAFAAGYGAATVTQLHGPDRFHWQFSELQWTSLPEFGGQEAIIHRSSDGKRVFAAFREAGHAAFKYPFDEFGYVTSGSATVSVRGGPSFSLSKGDVFVFKEGMDVDFEFSKDFSDLTCLIADHAVKWR